MAESMEEETAQFYRRAAARSQDVSIRKLLGDSVVSAIEKLMGLVLTAIGVEMVLAGLKRYFVGGL